MKKSEPNLKERILQVVEEEPKTREEIIQAVKDYSPTHGQIVRIIWGLTNHGLLTLTDDYRFVRTAK